MWDVTSRFVSCFRTVPQTGVEILPVWPPSIQAASVPVPRSLARAVARPSLAVRGVRTRPVLCPLHGSAAATPLPLSPVHCKSASCDDGYTSGSFALSKALLKHTNENGNLSLWHLWILIAIGKSSMARPAFCCVSDPRVVASAPDSSAGPCLYHPALAVAPGIAACPLEKWLDLEYGIEIGLRDTFWAPNSFSVELEIWPKQLIILSLQNEFSCSYCE